MPLHGLGHPAQRHRADDAEDLRGETIDVTIARKIGRTTRFQTLTATATGDVRTSFSYENANSLNAAEWSPVNFYTTLFGPGYQDPNATSFTPDPRVMVRKSVLSGVLDQTKRQVEQDRRSRRSRAARAVLRRTCATSSGSSISS